MAVAQMRGHLTHAACTHIGKRGVDSCLTGVGLRRQRKVDGCLRQVDATLRIADHLGRFERSVRDEACNRVDELISRIQSTLPAAEQQQNG